MPGRGRFCPDSPVQDRFMGEIGRSLSTITVQSSPEQRGVGLSESKCAEFLSRGVGKAECSPTQELVSARNKQGDAGGEMGGPVQKQLQNVFLRLLLTQVTGKSRQQR